MLIWCPHTDTAATSNTPQNETQSLVGSSCELIPTWATVALERNLLLLLMLKVFCFNKFCYSLSRSRAFPFLAFLHLSQENCCFRVKLKWARSEIGGMFFRSSTAPHFIWEETESQSYTVRSERSLYPPQLRGLEKEFATLYPRHCLHLVRAGNHYQELPFWLHSWRRWLRNRLQRLHWWECKGWPQVSTRRCQGPQQGGPSGSSRMACMYIRISLSLSRISLTFNPFS